MIRSSSSPAIYFSEKWFTFYRPKSKETFNSYSWLYLFSTLLLYDFCGFKLFTMFIIFTFF